MGGETGFGGSEVVVLMKKDAGGPPAPRYEYKLLATNKTSTMQKELLEAGEAGFDLIGLAVASTAFGGSELVSLLRRERAP